LNYLIELHFSIKVNRFFLTSRLSNWKINHLFLAAFAVGKDPVAFFHFLTLIGHFRSLNSHKWKQNEWRFVRDLFRSHVYWNHTFQLKEVILSFPVPKIVVHLKMYPYLRAIFEHCSDFSL